MIARCIVSLCLLMGAAAHAASSEGYLRTPDLHGDRIVFCAEGDLWLCADTGGMARRLTTHPGTEFFPRFDPQGRRIAFTGAYDGNMDIFVMPAEGGEPRRLTWHPATDELIDWTPDGEALIFRSRREHPHGSAELFRIPVAGGDPEKLPLGWAARLDIDPDSGRWAFNRMSREYATWKRYRGGTAPEIWVGDPAKGDFAPVTDFAGTDAHPMWHGGRIYFISDQGGTAVLLSIRREISIFAWLW